MPMKISAGLLMYRLDNGLEIFLAHLGGPLFKNKDDGFWGIPKGEVQEGEQLFAAALREFTEETGITANGPFIPLHYIVQKSGKKVYAWAFQGTCDPAVPFNCNQFEMEWPPKSGKQQWFPEMDKAEFFPAAIARQKINPYQVPLIDRLEELLK